VGEIVDVDVAFDDRLCLFWQEEHFFAKDFSNDKNEKKDDNDVACIQNTCSEASSNAPNVR